MPPVERGDFSLYRVFAHIGSRRMLAFFAQFCFHFKLTLFRPVTSIPVSFNLSWIRQLSPITINTAPLSDYNQIVAVRILFTFDHSVAFSLAKPGSAFNCSFVSSSSRSSSVILSLSSRTSATCASAATFWHSLYNRKNLVKESTVISLCSLRF